MGCNTPLSPNPSLCLSCSREVRAADAQWPQSVLGEDPNSPQAFLEESADNQIEMGFMCDGFSGSY